MSLDSIAKTIDTTVSDIVKPVADAVGEVVFYSVPVGGTELP